MSKRQSNILNYFGKPTPKQSRNEPQAEPDSPSPPQPAPPPPPPADESEDDMDNVNSDSDSDDDRVDKGTEKSGPSTIWTAEQFNIHKTKHPWLIRKGAHFGCSTCGQVGSLGPEKTGLGEGVKLNSGCFAPLTLLHQM